jgi:hypothetical protein
MLASRAVAMVIDSKLEFVLKIIFEAEVEKVMADL